MGWQGLNKHLFFATVAPIYAASHPVFAGIKSPTLHCWDTFDGRVSDDVFTRPANVKAYEPGNWRALAGGTRREHVSLAEIFYGQGILFSCQLNIIENIDNIQAQTLLSNILQYLSRREADQLDKKCTLRGKLTKDELVTLTGVSKTAFRNARAKQSHLMLATEGANIEEVKQWVARGGKALVLSRELSQSFAGVEVDTDADKLYLATQIADHPLLYGVSSTNFMAVDHPIVKGSFSTIPSNARVLLQGFSMDKSRVGSNLTSLWSIADEGPVLISIPCKKGEILLSTIEIDNAAHAASQELLSLLMTNSGVAVPFSQTVVEEIQIKKTVPVTVDGDLRSCFKTLMVSQ